jgi:single-strand DNA-binding protein
MNKAILIGNLTRDPEARTTPSGVAVTTFTIAVNRRFTNQQGVREADFIPIVTWRQTAELCARYLSKGRKVAVEGMIQTRSYDAQDGTKRYVTEIVADNVEFLSPNQQGEQRPRSADVPLPPEPNFTPASNGGFTEVEDDELPF